MKTYQRLFPDRDTQEHFLWKNGLYAKIGNYKSQVLLSLSSPSEIRFTVKADVSSEAGHRLIWDMHRSFKSSLETFMKSTWRGLLRTYVIECTHCAIQSLLHGVNIKPFEWCFEDMEKMSSSNKEEICCRSESFKEDFPAALVVPMSQSKCKTCV